ncbi:MAG: polysaccharide biosynthesis protein, partial [Nitrospiraceae bacterium]|nr:polysaccharide biosynthesis protein [Nitrospiraceae bacterium]
MLSLQRTGHLKRIVKLITLGALICTANFMAFWLRFDGDIPSWAMDVFVKTLPLLFLVRLTMFLPFRLYGTVWQYTSFSDMVNLAGAALSGTLVFMIIVSLALGLNYPRSVYLIDTLLLIMLTGGVRVMWRMKYLSAAPRRRRRVLIYGAGGAGERLVSELRDNRAFGYQPVGFIDDNPRKTGQRIHGVKVLGTREQLPAIMRETAPEAVLIAMPSAGPEGIRETAKLLLGYNLSIKILPDLAELLDGKSELNQLRNLSLEDLLHRPRLDQERSWPASLLEGKRILVTGAGGSIGSELCRQIASYEPDALILYERYENSLFAIHGELCKQLPSSRLFPVIGDVTDKSRMQSTMEAYRPHIVFHAAAHKHVPLMEFNPCEAVKNNVFGTRMVATLADEMNVERFIMISTDKAVRPSSVMGGTKRIAEMIVQDIARTSRT